MQQVGSAHVSCHVCVQRSRSQGETTDGSHPFPTIPHLIEHFLWGWMGPPDVIWRRFAPKSEFKVDGIIRTPPEERTRPHHPLLPPLPPSPNLYWNGCVGCRCPGAPVWNWLVWQKWGESMALFPGPKRESGEGGVIHLWLIQSLLSTTAILS